MGEEHEPDPRFTLANERTFLAWIRTALALLASGVAIETIIPAFGISGVRAVLAGALTAMGLLIAASSYARWARTERALRHGQPLPISSVPRVVAAGVGLVCAVVLALLVTGRLSG